MCIRVTFFLITLNMCVPKSPSTQPQVSALRFVWRFLSSLIEGPAVGFGVMPSRAGVVSVGAGPLNATPFTAGSSAAPKILKVVEYFIMRIWLATIRRDEVGRQTNREEKA